LVFEVQEDFSAVVPSRVIGPDMQSQAHYMMFRDLIGQACLLTDPIVAPKKPVELATTHKRYATLQARQPAYVAVGVSVGPEGNCEAGRIWNGHVAVGQRGTAYEIPIPKAAFFGKQAFAATFDEAGGMTMLQYGKEPGGGGALAVLQAGYDAVRQTDAEKVSHLKGEADVIAAQQRLVKCQASPETCS
jgi:hypothetical protein